MLNLEKIEEDTISNSDMHSSTRKQIVNLILKNQKDNAIKDNSNQLNLPPPSPGEPENNVNDHIKFLN